MRELPRRRGRGRRPRCRALRSFTCGFHRYEAYEQPHGRGTLLQNQRREKAHARLQRQAHRRTALAARAAIEVVRLFIEKLTVETLTPGTPATVRGLLDRKSTRLNSRHDQISDAG